MKIWLSEVVNEAGRVVLGVSQSESNYAQTVVVGVSISKGSCKSNKPWELRDVDKVN